MTLKQHQKEIQNKLIEKIPDKLSVTKDIKVFPFVTKTDNNGSLYLNELVKIKKFDLLTKRLIYSYKIKAIKRKVKVRKNNIAVKRVSNSFLLSRTRMYKWNNLMNTIFRVNKLKCGIAEIKR